MQVWRYRFGVSIEIVLEEVIELETIQQKGVNLKEKKAKDANLLGCL